MENNVFMSGFSSTSTGFQSFSVNTDPQRFKGIQVDQYIKEKNYINRLFYHKILSWHFSFEKALNIKYVKYSLHVGDIIDFITRHTGIKKLIVKLTNGNCGCEARRIKFNKWFFIPFFKIEITNLSYADKIELDTKKVYEQYNKYWEQKPQINNSKYERIFKEQIENKKRGHAAIDHRPPDFVGGKPKKDCGCAAKKLTKLKNNV